MPPRRPAAAPETTTAPPAVPQALGGAVSVPPPPVFEPSQLDEWPGEDTTVLLTQIEFAERVKLTARQIHNLAELPAEKVAELQLGSALPTSMRGDQRLYPWPKALHWIIEYRVQLRVRKALQKEVAAQRAMGLAGAPGGPTAEEVLAAQMRATIAESLEKEAKAEDRVIKVQQQRAELMTIDDMAHAFEEALRPMRQALTNFPGRWADKMVALPDTRTARAQLDVAVLELRRILALDGEPDDDGDPDAAAAVAAPLPDPAPPPAMGVGKPRASAKTRAKVKAAVQGRGKSSGGRRA